LENGNKGFTFNVRKKEYNLAVKVSLPRLW